jgi:hypothetical protein
VFIRKARWVVKDDKSIIIRFILVSDEAISPPFIKNRSVFITIGIEALVAPDVPSKPLTQFSNLELTMLVAGLRFTTVI